MLLEQARREAHERGQLLRPRVVEEFDAIDVADLTYAVLDETHPAEKAPSMRYDSVGRERWEGEREQIRLDVWEAFTEGLQGEPLHRKVIIEVV